MQFWDRESLLKPQVAAPSRVHPVEHHYRQPGFVSEEFGTNDRSLMSNEQTNLTLQEARKCKDNLSGLH